MLVLLKQNVLRLKKMIVTRQIIRRKRRESCIGDLNKRIILHNRSIQVPEFNSVDFKEKFKPIKEIWANVNTSTGQVLFNNVGVDVAISHTIIIRFDSSVTPETWVEFKNNNLKIMDLENLEERDEFLRLRCVNRGNKDLESVKA